MKFEVCIFNRFWNRYMHVTLKKNLGVTCQWPRPFPKNFNDHIQTDLETLKHVRQI